jgi:hypothetical protein
MRLVGLAAQKASRAGNCNDGAMRAAHDPVTSCSQYSWPWQMRKFWTTRDNYPLPSPIISLLWPGQIRFTPEQLPQTLTGAMCHVLRGTSLAALSIARPSAARFGGLRAVCAPSLELARTEPIAARIQHDRRGYTGSTSALYTPQKRGAAQKNVDDRPWHRESSGSLPKSTSPDPSGGDTSKGW